MNAYPRSPLAKSAPIRPFEPHSEASASSERPAAAARAEIVAGGGSGFVPRRDSADGELAVSTAITLASAPASPPSATGSQSTDT